MNIFKLIQYTVSSALILYSSSSLAVFSADSTAETVAVKQSCDNGSGGIINNCFSTLPELTSWMKSTRKPDATKPLQVNIGTGTFAGPLRLVCDSTTGYTGFTSFSGTGSGQTIIQGASDFSPPILVSSCTELNFSDFKTSTDFYGGVQWNGGGNSSWTNIVIDAQARAWYESSCGTERGNHYWYSSKLNATAVFTLAKTYRATCDESWFFGSEVTVTVPDGVTGRGAAVIANTNGIIHLYGSVLRALVDGPGNVSAAEVGLTSGWTNVTGGEIHIHGTGIDAISKTGMDVRVFRATAGGMIHADASGYNLSTTGTKTRIDNDGGKVMAQHTWGQNNQPPAVTSENGADMTVETNCDVISCHDEDTGTETHLLIYNSSCNVSGHGPWFDVVTRKCRGDMSVN